MSISSGLSRLTPDNMASRFVGDLDAGALVLIEAATTANTKTHKFDLSSFSSWKTFLSYFIHNMC